MKKKHLRRQIAALVEERDIAVDEAEESMAELQGVREAAGDPDCESGLTETELVKREIGSRDSILETVKQNRDSLFKELNQHKSRADSAEAEAERLSSQLKEQVPASRVLCDGSVVCDVCGETVTGTPHFYKDCLDTVKGWVPQRVFEELNKSKETLAKSTADLAQARVELDESRTTADAFEKLVNELVNEKHEIGLALGIPEGTIVHEGVPAVAQRQREELEAAKERLKFYEGTASKLSWAEQVLASGEARERLSGLLGLTTSDVTGDARQVASWAAIEERVELQERSLQKVSRQLEAWRASPRYLTFVDTYERWATLVPIEEITVEVAHAEPEKPSVLDQLIASAPGQEGRPPPSSGSKNTIG